VDASVEETHLHATEKLSVENPTFFYLLASLERSVHLAVSPPLSSCTSYAIYLLVAVRCIEFLEYHQAVTVPCEA
jgi:hypothetical protein